jgi:homoserine dehydrogenase
MMPTASAVVGDLIDVAVGRAALTARALDAWSASAPPARLAPPAEVRSRYYLRFTIADRPGVLASLAHVLGLHGISIASVIQHDPGDDAPPSAPVPLVIMIHHAAEAGILAAIQTVDRLDVVHAPSVCLGVQD